MSAPLERINPSILTRIVALVAASLLLALAAMMLVAFRGPPPHARPMLLGEAAQLREQARLALEGPDRREVEDRFDAILDDFTRD